MIDSISILIVLYFIYILFTVSKKNILLMISSILLTMVCVLKYLKDNDINIPYLYKEKNNKDQIEFIEYPNTPEELENTIYVDNVNEYSDVMMDFLDNEMTKNYNYSDFLNRSYDTKNLSINDKIKDMRNIKGQTAKKSMIGNVRTTKNSFIKYYKDELQYNEDRDWYNENHVGYKPEWATTYLD